MIGEILFEGMGKSNGPGFIKSIGMEGVTSIYTWSVDLKGMGKAMGANGNLSVTAKSMTPPKGIAWAKDQGIFRSMTGEMAVVKGVDLMKMTMGTNPMSVGLWTFMTMSEKWMWLNDTIALVTFEAMDPMWMQFKVTIHEWK